MKEDRVIGWVSKPIQALGPTQAEAKAVLEEMKAMSEMENSSGIVSTDSLETVHALSQTQPTIMDWRSYEELWQAWSLMNSSHSYSVQHCNRGSENVTKAHQLANQGRIYQWDRKGDLEPVFSLEEIV